MRASLLLSVAAATLSLSLSSGSAQNAGRDQNGGEAAARPGQSEMAAPQRKRGHRARSAHGRHHEPHGERTQTQGERSGEARGNAAAENEAKASKPKRSDAKGLKESGEGRSEKTGEAAKNEMEHDGERGAAIESIEPSRTDAQTHGARELDFQGGSGPSDQRNEPAGRSTENRTGPAENDSDRAPIMGQRGEAAQSQRESRDVFGATEKDERRGAASRDEGGTQGLSARDQTRLRDMIARRSGVAVSRNDVDIRIGAVVPGGVQVSPLPPEAFGVAPQYRGYDFVRVEDQIVIVDPRSREIVALLGEGGPPASTYGYEERGGAYEGSRGESFGSARPEESRGSARGEAYGYAPPIRLDKRQERALYLGAMQEARTNLRQVCLHVGDRVPESVDMAPTPRQIAAETPDLARFDYFVLNDQVVLVDPDSRQVVEIIEEPR